MIAVYSSLGPQIGGTNDIFRHQALFVMEVYLYESLSFMYNVFYLIYCWKSTWIVKFFLLWFTCPVNITLSLASYLVVNNRRFPIHNCMSYFWGIQNSIAACAEYPSTCYEIGLIISSNNRASYYTFNFRS